MAMTRAVPHSQETRFSRSTTMMRGGSSVRACRWSSGYACQHFFRRSNGRSKEERFRRNHREARLEAHFRLRQSRYVLLTPASVVRHFQAHRTLRYPGRMRPGHAKPLPVFLRGFCPFFTLSERACDCGLQSFVPVLECRAPRFRNGWG